MLLSVEVPRANDKKELAAEQMFAALHGIFKPRQEFFKRGDPQDHVSFEIASIKQQIRFYIWTPNHLQTFVEGQIYAQYPTAQIFKLDQDYSQRDLKQSVLHTAELALQAHETIPIKTFPSFEVDPLASVTATLAKLEAQDEEMWIQVIARPVADEWHKKGNKYINKIKSGGALTGVGGVALQLLSAPFKAPETSDNKTEKKLSERQQARIEAVSQKIQKLGYQVKIRILYAGHDETTARLRMQAIVGAFKQFNTTHLNGFVQKRASYIRERLADYQSREFITSGYILNIEELASVFHLPHTSVETPNIVWASSKTAEPPTNLPTTETNKDSELSLFGSTDFRDSNRIFGALRSDRGRHIYIIGQTGTGKSGLLELLVLADLFYDRGYAIIDPHGDFATNNLRFIPERRLDDVVYFNPADTDYPMAFNPLEVVDPTQKVQISSELVGIMKRMFDSWGPRLEYILRYTILALLDYPSATMLDITKMLTDKKFRNKVVSHIDDFVVKNFWTTEFASWSNQYQTEAIAPVLNKVGAFTANPMIRNIVGQPKGSFNIREIMDQGKILVMNLARGLVGEDNAGILGAMMVTKIQLAAMSRANIKELKNRKPFYLYVDEFQNFATDSFAVILSEARKYGLNLAVANQYISQMPEEVRSAVFGNVGSIISFRVSPDDAPFLEKYFEPQFNAQDIIQLANRSFVATMTIKGEKVPPFSGRTLDIPSGHTDNTQAIIELSRQRYAMEKAMIEQMMRGRNDDQQDQPPGKRSDRAENKPQDKTNVVTALKKVIGITMNPDSTKHRSIKSLNKKGVQGKGRPKKTGVADENKSPSRTNNKKPVKRPTPRKIKDTVSATKVKKGKSRPRNTAQKKSQQRHPQKKTDTLVEDTTINLRH